MDSLLLVGCGKMGGALLERWRETSAAREFFIIDPSPVAPPKNILTFPSLDALPKNCAPDAVVLAVKPQEMAAMLPAYAQRFGDAPLYLSIAAGKTLAFFSRHLGAGAKVVRIMPNLPALIGEGATVLCAAPTVTAETKAVAYNLMKAAGQAWWIDDEQLMDAVTAISGSGPAYVFLFLDALAKAGESLGLAPDLAKSLATATVTGSAKLAAQSKESFAALIQNVASPGGTTEAALAILTKEGRFESLLAEAARAAARRSKELSE